MAGRNSWPSAYINVSVFNLITCFMTWTRTVTVRIFFFIRMELSYKILKLYIIPRTVTAPLLVFFLGWVRWAMIVLNKPLFGRQVMLSCGLHRAICIRVISSRDDRGNLDPWDFFLAFSFNFGNSVSHHQSFNQLSNQRCCSLCSLMYRLLPLFLLVSFGCCGGYLSPCYL